VSKALVAYFSCTGTTQALAETLAAVVEGDLYRIEPAVQYTDADLDWHDESSRSSVEMRDRALRPEIAGEPLNLDGYGVIYLGSPIWWGVPPTIVNTFLESHDFSGKTLIPFVTSGSSEVGETDQRLHSSCSSNTNWYPATRLASNTGADQLRRWAKPFAT
jgi:flavodoxin